SGTRVDPNRFVEQAAMGGMFEVRSAELALDRAESDQVQNFARRLREDHSKANTELEETARKLGITVPSTMGPEHERKLQELESLTGEQFETRFLEIQRDVHQQAIDLFQRAADQLPEGDLSKFAADKLP